MLLYCGAKWSLLCGCEGLLVEVCGGCGVEALSVVGGLVVEYFAQALRLKAVQAVKV